MIELGGLRLLHVGDTEVSARDVRPHALGDAGVDADAQGMDTEILFEYF